MPFSLTGGSTARAYDLAYTVLAGVILVAVLPFALLSLVKNKHGKDPARKFVPWLKNAFLAFIITLGLLVAQGALNSYEIYSDESHWHIVRASYHVGYLYEFFRTVLSALLTVYLFELSPGLHHALDGVTNMFDKVIRYTAYAMAAIVICLAIAYYGLLVDFQENYTNNIGYITRDAAGFNRIQDVNRLMSATAIILWVESLVITSLSIYAFIQRRMSPMRTASILYLIASLLNLLSSTWNFAYSVHWLLESSMQQEQPYYVLILSIILSHWSQGVLLIISFFVAKRSVSAGGIWSPIV
ncbi:hypothetical protein S40293_11129 [Stachybotrys chartarum IBT 40293]|nr:hypothetical protein S40293_11129 [Stachybotrys chartarum IBT 40293]KFA70699.1 hypothetical protein S40288_11249 [Stachybotrys chartarum IBT 40288]